VCGIPEWTTEVLSVSPPVGRVLALNSALDFDDELKVFSDQFLAPAAIPPARRQYDIGKTADQGQIESFTQLIFRMDWPNVHPRKRAVFLLSYFPKAN
jgi:hypothetical protein